MHSDLILVIPVYNDWESVQMVIRRVELQYGSTYSLQYVLVNDSSIQEPDVALWVRTNTPVLILELSRNMGHQKAIATGLSYVNEHFKADHVIVMDADGEDRPEDIQHLLDCATEFNGVIFAKRTKRSEGLFFRIFYRLYKLVFVLLTGKTISFGNFCLVPSKYLRKMVHVSDIWNHFSGGVIRSGIPYTAVATTRGKRYFGQSKMNFARLILHGLSAVAVYADFMSVRLILLSFLMVITTILGIAAVIGVRLFTTLAIPGWATFTVLGLGILFFLALLMGLFLLFNVLTLKTQRGIIPAKDYKDFITDVKQVNTPAMQSQSLTKKEMIPAKDLPGRKKYE
jgi:polyisoprenyl-phosphate glycosyltransferase